MVLAGLAQIQAIEKEFADQERQQTMTATEFAIYKATEAADARKAAFKGTAEQLARYEVLNRQQLQQTVDEIRGSNVTLIGGATEVGAANEQAAKKCQVGYSIAFHAAGGGFAAFKGAVIQGNEEMIQSAFGVVDAYAKVLNAIGTPQSTPGMPRTASSADIAGGNFGRAAGGPVAASVPYLVGERGPELFVPDRAGTIVPNGGGSSPVNISITVNGSVLSGKRELAAAVGDALMTSLRASGMRLPSRG